jgi:hypothetical protein
MTYFNVLSVPSLETPFISNHTVGAYCNTPLRGHKCAYILGKFEKAFLAIHIAPFLKRRNA